jgi:hypothetical protein
LSIKITLECETFEDGAALLLALGADQRAGRPAARPTGGDAAGNASTAKTGKNAASSPPATQSPAPAAASGGKGTGQAKAPSPSPTPSPAASASLRDKKYPETGIAELINKFAAASKDNRTVAVQVLEALGGAKKGGDLTSEYYDAAHAAFTALNAGTAANVVLAGLAGGEPAGEEDTGLG